MDFRRVINNLNEDPRTNVKGFLFLRSQSISTGSRGLRSVTGPRLRSRLPTFLRDDPFCERPSVCRRKRSGGAKTKHFLKREQVNFVF